MPLLAVSSRTSMRRSVGAVLYKSGAADKSFHLSTITVDKTADLTPTNHAYFRLRSFFICDWLGRPGILESYFRRFRLHLAARPQVGALEGNARPPFRNPAAGWRPWSADKTHCQVLRSSNDDLPPDLGVVSTRSDSSGCPHAGLGMAWSCRESCNDNRRLDSFRFTHRSRG